MRIRRLALVLSACAGLAGCVSGSSVDALDLGKPSAETTASVVPPPANPAKAVGEAATVEEVVGLAEEQDADIAVEAGFAPPASVAEETSVKQIALMSVPNPAAKPERTAPARAKVMPQRFRDAHPINFGKVGPRHHAVHGVDVSRWQGEIDWPKLRAQGANFAWIKATDGGDHLDPMFHRNWRAAEAAGIRRGAYHFFYWCRNASSQADWFIRNVPRVAGALPPVIDVEWNHLSSCKKRPSRAAVLEKMQVFMDRLEKHYGQRPVIYTAPDFYKDNLQGAFPNHPFWLRSVAAHPSKVYPGRDWVIWQYSGSGLSHGVDGRIDLNVFNGDETAWRRWLGKNAG